MKIEILYFAQLREILGREKDTVELPDDAVVRDAVHWVLSQRGAKCLDAASLMKAVNEEFCTEERQLVQGDRLALLPPTAGG